MPEVNKIMLVGKLPPPYMGPSVAFELLINSELKNKFDLSYLNIKANESLDTLGKWSAGKVLTNIKIYNRFYIKVKSSKPDLILIPISQSLIGFFKDSVFVLIASVLGCKTVLQLRGGNFRNWYSGLSYLFKKYIRTILNKSEGVIVLGNNLKYLFEGLYRPDQIYVVPNGGNYPLSKKNNTTNHKVKIIYTGNLQSSKGIEDVIQAMVELNKSDSDKFELDVIGNWRNENTKQQCISLINKFQLPVTFFNHLSGTAKMDKIFQGDIFVFTPRKPEGHPWVIVEAMAAGLPIIATDQGAITESVKSAQNGYIVKSHNPEEIARHLSILINNPELRKEMGRKSREFYESSFTEEIMVNNYAKTFNSILQLTNKK